MSATFFSICYRHDTEHAEFHMKEQVAMEGPLAELAGLDIERQALARFDVDGVLQRQPGTHAVLQHHPHAVQVNRMVHHRVVDESDAKPFTQGEGDGL